MADEGYTVVHKPGGMPYLRISHAGFKLIRHADGKCIIYPVDSDDYYVRATTEDSEASKSFCRILRLSGRGVGVRKNGDHFFKSITQKVCEGTLREERIVRRNGVVDWALTCASNHIRCLIRDLCRERPELIPALPDLHEFHEYTHELLEIEAEYGKSLTRLRRVLYENGDNARYCSHRLDGTLRKVLLVTGQRYRLNSTYNSSVREWADWTVSQVIASKKVAYTHLNQWKSFMERMGPEFQQEVLDRADAYCVDDLNSENYFRSVVRTEVRIGS